MTEVQWEELSSCENGQNNKLSPSPTFLINREWLDSGTMYSIISSIAEIPFKYKQVATTENAIYHWVKKPRSDEGPEKSHTDALFKQTNKKKTTHSHVSLCH